MKSIYLLVIGIIVAAGCGAQTPAEAPGHYVPFVKKTDKGGVVLPTGVPLPPEAVKAGAAKGFDTSR